MTVIKSVLFLCVANSARSQMAEGLARWILGDGISVNSAGSRPTRVSAHAVRVMREIGIDISSQRSKGIEAIDPAKVDVVVTLCREEVCPRSFERSRMLHWPIEDPAQDESVLSPDRVLARFRAAREAIRECIHELAHSLGVGSS